MHPHRNSPRSRRPSGRAVRLHWPEYLMEAAALGIFMISAGGFTALLESPGSVATHAITDPFLRRVLIGLAMGGTATLLTYSPWGRRSGAHMNPAITLTFLRLKKIPWVDAVFYVVFQFLGGLAGVLVAAWIFGSSFTSAPVSYVVTVPGSAGTAAAFAGEWVIASMMMAMILFATNHRVLARFTGLFAGILITGFVTFESPLSGFGMNPARTFASALPSGIWTALWLYFLAPLTGMLAASELTLLFREPDSIRCCKLHHRSARPCIFCGRPVQPAGADPRTVTS